MTKTVNTKKVSGRWMGGLGIGFVSGGVITYSLSSLLWYYFVGVGIILMIGGALLQESP